MKGKKISIKGRSNEKRARVRKSKGQSSQPHTSMVPLLRCSVDPNACPASGSIVALFSEAEIDACIVCGRAIRIRGRASKNDQRLGRVPSHRRADFEAREEGRTKTQRLRCKLDQAEKAAREALRRRAPKRAAKSILRARAIAERLPQSEQLQQRLHRLDNRVFVAHAKKQQARASMPKDPKRILHELVNASAIDVGAVEPDGWIDHVGAALPECAVIPIAREPSTSWIRLGLVALIRRAAPKSWMDLERRGFAGDRSLLAFIREFPGLEQLRLPDHAYDADAANALLNEDIPF